MSRIKHAILLAFSLSLVIVLYFPRPAISDGDQLGQAFVELAVRDLVGLLISLICVEALVMIAEAFVLRWMLRLPMRTALLWSFLASMATLVLGTRLLSLIYGPPYTSSPVDISLIPVSIPIAISIHYLVLTMLNTKQTTNGPIILYCIIVSVITVPLIYITVPLIRLVVRSSFN